MKFSNFLDLLLSMCCTCSSFLSEILRRSVFFGILLWYWPSCWNGTKTLLSYWHKFILSFV